MLLYSILFEMAGWALALVLFVGIFLVFEAVTYGNRLDVIEARAVCRRMLDVLRRTIGR